MNISKSILRQAQEEHILGPGQADALWEFLEKNSDSSGAFSVSNMLYYLGGMMAILAMSLFMTAGYEMFGELGLAILACCYAGLGIWMAERSKRKGQLALCGISAVFSLVQVPLLVFCVMSPAGVDYQSYHVTIQAQWLVLEFATLLSAAVALYRYRLPFLLMPVAVTLWYMSMDIAIAIAATVFSMSYDWEFRLSFSAVWGLLVLLIAFYVDLRNKQIADFAFWLYLSGLLCLSLGSVFFSFTMNGVAELIAIGVVIAMHVLLMFFGVAIARRQFVVFGSVGMFMCLSYLAFDVFENSDWWWLALTIAGFGVIRLGQLWHRYEKAISMYCQSKVPESVRCLVHSRQLVSKSN